MRDPTANAKVEAAITEACTMLRCYVPLGSPPPNETADAKRHREAFGYVTASPDMPKHTRAHLLKLLAKDKRNGSKRATANRNLWIALVVERVCELGFDATSDNGESACNVVASALARLGINLADRTIEDVWVDYRTRLPVRVIARHIVRKK
jgi:hypothetical protein